MIFRYFLISIYAVCYGLLSAAGVFTVLVAVGLIPRFAGKTHTANKVFLYEEMVVFGTIFGCLISIFPNYLRLSNVEGSVFQVLFGFFSGMFTGCLALAIAEMLDSIPIFARRISFKRGIGLAVISMAFGKLLGSLVYFLKGI